MAALLGEKERLSQELDVKQAQLNEVSSALADARQSKSETDIANDDLKKEVADLQGRLLDSVSRVEREESQWKLLGAQASRSKLNESALQEQLAHLTKALDDSQKERVKLEGSEREAQEKASSLSLNLEEIKLALGLAEQDLRLFKQKQESLMAQVDSLNLKVAKTNEENEKLQRTLEALRKSTNSVTNELKEVESSVSEFLSELETSSSFEALWRNVRREHMELLMSLPRDKVPQATGGRDQQRSILKSILTALAKEGESNRQAKGKLSMLEQALEDERQASSESSLRLEEKIHKLEREARAAREEAQHARHLLSIAEGEIERRNEMLRGLSSDRDLLRIQALSALQSNDQDAMAAETLRGQLKEREDLLDRLWIASLQAKASLEQLFTGAQGSSASSTRDGFEDWSNSGSFRSVEAFLSDVQGKISLVISDGQELKRREADRKRERDAIAQELEQLEGLLSASRKEKAPLLARITSLESDLASTLAKLSDLTSSEKRLATENTALRSDLQDVQREMRHLDESRRSLLDELKMISASASSWKDEAHRREEEARERQRVRLIDQSEMERLHGQVTLLTAKTEQAEAGCQAAKKRAEEAELQVEDLARRLASASRSAQESISKQQEATSRLALVETDARLKASDLESRLTSAEESLALAQTKLYAKTVEMDSSVRGLSEENASLQLEVEKAMVGKEEAEARYEKCERQLEELRSFVSQMAREREELSEAAEQRDRLQRQLDSAAKDRDRERERERSLIRRVEELQGELNTSHGERMRLAGLLEAAKLDQTVAKALTRRRD